MAKYIVVHGIRVAKDFVPETFGRLTTVGPKFWLPVGKCRSYKAMQVCHCNCGNQNLIVAMSSNLVTGNTNSCGCLQRERTANAVRRHGMAGTPEYIAWTGAITRCTNTNEAGYEEYGGRGIKVHEPWMELEGRGFSLFFAHIGTKPTPKHELDRINVNGNYEPGNVRWATREEQNRNRRNNINLTHNGKTQCIAAWAEETGIPDSTIRSRLRYGWSVEKTLTEPIRKLRKRRKTDTQNPGSGV